MRMQLPAYLGLQRHAESTLAESFRVLADSHAAEADIRDLCGSHAKVCDGHGAALDELIRTYGQRREHEPERMRDQGLRRGRGGPVGLLRDLQDVYLLASFADITWAMIRQAAEALPDQKMIEAVSACEQETSAQLRWLRTRMQVSAPQALLAVD